MLIKVLRTPLFYPDAYRCQLRKVNLQTVTGIEFFALPSCATIQNQTDFTV